MGVEYRPHEEMWRKWDEQVLSVVLFFDFAERGMAGSEFDPSREVAFGSSGVQILRLGTKCCAVLRLAQSGITLFGDVCNFCLLWC